jgi:hypothetical protein
MTAEIFECSCYSDEHHLIFKYDENSFGDGESELYTTIYLNQYRNIFKRILVAVKYIFGYRCKYGHWDVWTMLPEDCDRMIKLLEKFKSSK